MAEYLNRDFRPSLTKLRLDSEELRLLDQYRIPYIGNPAPTTDGRKGAVWLSEFIGSARQLSWPPQRFLEHHSVPVLDGFWEL